MFLEVMAVNYILWVIVNIAYISDRNIGHFLKLTIEKKITPKKTWSIRTMFLHKTIDYFKVLYLIEVLKELYSLK